MVEIVMPRGHVKSLAQFCERKGFLICGLLRNAYTFKADNLSDDSNCCWLFLSNSRAPHQIDQSKFKDRIQYISAVFAAIRGHAIGQLVALERERASIHEVPEEHCNVIVQLAEMMEKELGNKVSVHIKG